MHIVISHLTVHEPQSNEVVRDLQQDAMQPSREIDGIVSGSLAKVADDHLVTIIFGEAPAALEQLSHEIGGPRFRRTSAPCSPHHRTARSARCWRRPSFDSRAATGRASRTRSPPLRSHATLTRSALVAQGIEHRPPEPCARVRIAPRAPMRLALISVDSSAGSDVV